MNPSVNVNLTPCDAPRSPGYVCPHVHCAARPILIRCDILRSMTFSVTLGECVGPRRGCSVPRGKEHHSLSACPARPVRVSCSISGKTWEESVVQEVDLDDVHPHALTAAVNACRDRWALVKALVLGKTFDPTEWDSPETIRALLSQRDEVYAALTELVRAELAHFNVSTGLFTALKACDVERKHVIGPASYAMGWSDPSDDAAALNSRAGLAAYVEMLVEKVGTLP